MSLSELRSIALLIDTALQVFEAKPSPHFFMSFLSSTLGFKVLHAYYSWQLFGYLPF